MDEKPPTGSDALGSAQGDWTFELRTVLEEVLDRKLSAAVAALDLRLREVEANRLSAGGLGGHLSADRARNGSGGWVQPNPHPGDLNHHDLYHDLLAAHHHPASEECSNPHSTNALPKKRAVTIQDAGEMSNYMRKEVEDRYEDLYDITRAFHSLCNENCSSIGVKDLMNMHAIHENIKLDHEDATEMMERFSSSIQVLKYDFGMGRQPGMCGDDDDMTLDLFMLIMQRWKDVCSQCDMTVLCNLAEIRDILLREDAFRKVAKATNTTADDLQAIRHGKIFRHPNRIMCVLQWIDPFIGLIIVLNAMVICLSTDVATDSPVWEWCERVFTVIFIAELTGKILALGPHQFFCGIDWAWNCFDTIAVLFGSLDAILSLLDSDRSTYFFTLGRLVRFMRLTRLVRVLKLKLFKELILMVNGILVGFRTLIWAIVFLAFLLIFLGVVMTRLVGKADVEFWGTLCHGLAGADHARCLTSADYLQDHASQMFGNVLRSMFTVFRCFTDGCASLDGTPLVPYFYDTHGILFVLSYMLVILFVTFGLFNLVMAVFVENTIVSAKRADIKRQEAQWNEHLRVARKLQEVIAMICTGKSRDSDAFRGVFRWLTSWFGTYRSSKGTNIYMSPEIMVMKVTHDQFMKVLESPEVQELLDDLDIDFHSRHTIFDVLDANGNGTLEVTELVNGLLRLRGAGEKGDQVACLLAIRAIQKSLKAMEVLGLHQQQVIQGVAATQKRMLEGSAPHVLKDLAKGRSTRF